jgi:AcrR family transcriptional regulator/DNA-binding MarR family transcriptional regulator
VRRPGSVSGFSSSRARIVQAMRELACEQGYQAVSATALIGRARVSSKTFYENFADTDECFIAAYDEATAEIEGEMRPAYMRPGTWTQRVRAALEALLTLVENDRGLATLVFLEAPKARELLGDRRARILEILRLVLDSGRSGENATATPSLIDEVLVEGAISVIRARVASPQDGSLSPLVDELISVITYSYTGAPTTVASPPLLTPGQLVAPTSKHPSTGLPTHIRMTYRTLRVLTAVAQNPGGSNRQIAEVAEISDQGQISKILRRLSDQGLLRNDGLHRNGAPKRWHLTDRGRAAQRRGERDLNRSRASPN